LRRRRGVVQHRQERSPWPPRRPDTTEDISGPRPCERGRISRAMHATMAMMMVT
jgi:hypothetical protein